MFPPRPEARDDVSDSLRLALRLTALALLLRPMGPDIVRALLLVLGAVALLYSPVLTRAVTWYAAAALVALRVLADWPLADNHIYLVAYWCLAAGLALGSTRPTYVIAVNVRWLIGLAFLMAVIWKGVLSPDYVDGRFFRVTLLSDQRLEGAARLLGGLTPAQLATNREAMKSLPEGAELLDPPALVEPPAFRRLAFALTWGGLALEALVAASFLLTLPVRWIVIRHVLLLTFSAATYAIAPVAGFGWVLIAMGVAITATHQSWLRAAYITVWLGVLVASEVPWLTWLADAQGSTIARSP